MRLNTQKSRQINGIGYTDGYDVYSDVSQLGPQHITMIDSKFKPMYQTSMVIKGEEDILDENQPHIPSKHLSPPIALGTLPELVKIVSFKPSMTQTLHGHPAMK